MNPVDFSEFENTDGFQKCCDELSEFNWKNRIVGFNSFGVLYVDEKIPQQGFYLFFPKICEWHQIQNMRVKRKIALFGMLAGVFLLFIAFCAFRAGWIVQTHTGPGIVFIPLIFGAGGIILIFGCRRNSARLRTKDNRVLKWVSGPMLNRVETIVFCQSLTVAARRNSVQIASDYVTPD